MRRSPSGTRTGSLIGEARSAHLGTASPRTLAAIMAAKGAILMSRRLRLGGGTALPGLVAQRLDSHVLVNLAGQLRLGSVLVTGTNGKTTTARMVSRIITQHGWWPVNNPTGSNLMRGIVAALADASDLKGRIEQPQRRIGVFEVDEATAEEAAAQLRPRAFTLTNLFRDQLDRYGEVDKVAASWRRALSYLPTDAVVVANADDPSVVAVASGYAGPVVYFGIEDTACSLAQPEHAADARWCNCCGSEYDYAANFYGHLGHWQCPGCGERRPSPQVRVCRVTPTDSGTTVTIAAPDAEACLLLPLQGLYNVYNALAAAATASAFAIPLSVATEALQSFAAVFGRQERLQVASREVHILLGKNPAGFNQLLRTLPPDGAGLSLLFILNDDIADGHDISWIWDVDFEVLSGRALRIMASGRRAYDMALRLKYAGLAVDLVEANIRSALEQAIARTPPGERLYVLPTYTALLQARGWLARWGHKAAFWEEEKAQQKAV